jgi:hypothetical protein
MEVVSKTNQGDPQGKKIRGLIIQVISKARRYKTGEGDHEGKEHIRGDRMWSKRLFLILIRILPISFHFGIVGRFLSL